MKAFVIISAFCLDSTTVCHFDHKPDITEYDTSQECVFAMAEWISGMLDYFQRVEHVDKLPMKAFDHKTYPEVVVGVYLTGRAAAVCVPSNLTAAGREALRTTPK